MNFVTKKEFEDALAVIKRALKNDQIAHGQDSSCLLNALLFGRSDPYHSDFVLPEQIAFVNPSQAAKNKLFAINMEIKQRKQDVDDKQKNLEQLELDSKKLTGILSTLKE